MPWVLHLLCRCYSSPVPTKRPRHVITETDDIARALDDAAERWPEHRGARGALLRRLIAEGHRELVDAHALATAARAVAVEETAGALTGLYGTDYLAALREDWPA